MRCSAGDLLFGRVFAFGGGAWRAEGGWVSRCYGAREAAPDRRLCERFVRNYINMWDGRLHRLFRAEATTPQ